MPLLATGGLKSGPPTTALMLACWSRSFGPTWSCSTSCCPISTARKLAMESRANVVSPATDAERNGSTDGAFASALESAKLQALYNFAYGLSHEINNPLANIATRAQTLLVGEKNPERRRKLATIVQQ